MAGKLAAWFTRGAERSILVKRNILYSFLLRGSSIAINLMLVPLTINYINPTRYGIWLTLSSIIGWVGFFDIGFGNGFRNKFAEAIAKGKFRLAKIYVSTTYAILSIIIAGVLILFLLLNPFINWAAILNTPAAMRGELQLLSTCVVVIFCLQFVFQLINVFLTANQRPARASMLNLLGNLFSLISIFILKQTAEANLVLLGLFLSLMPMLVLVVANFWYFRREYPQFAPSLKYVNFRFGKDLLGLGLKFFIIQLSALVLFQTNNLVISQLLGPAEVSPYNIAFKYFGVVHMLFLIVLSPFWSAYTDAYFRHDLNWIRATTQKLVKCWLLLVVCVLAMTFISDYVYKLWVGDELKIGFDLSVSCACYVLIITWSAIFVNFVNGIGTIGLQLYYSIFIALINFPLTYFLVRNMGLGVAGLVYSNCISLMIGAVLGTIQYSKIVRGRAKGIWLK